MNMDGSHCALGSGNNGQLGVWCDVAGGVDTLDTSLSSLITEDKAGLSKDERSRSPVASKIRAASNVWES